jgi:hypothetical protein
LKKVKALILAAVAVSTAFLNPLLTQKVEALPTQDHVLGQFNIPSNYNQTQANNDCTTLVNYYIDWKGGTFVDASHGGTIKFFPFARPYVYGHLGLRKCVIVASWGYVAGPGHN